MASIKLGLSDELSLGNLDVRRDWGYAKEYVEAMWLMLQRDAPDDFVIGTGVSHSVDDLVDAAFACVDLEPRTMSGSSRTWRGPPTSRSSSRIPPGRSEELGWEARTTFEEVVEMMVKADLRELSSR